jgi:Ca-activated chloride channel family protein
MNGYSFAYPWLLAAGLLIPAVFAWRRWRGRAPVWLVPYAAAWTARGRPPSGAWRMAALYAALALLIVAAARPQRVDQREEIVSRGYDLMLAIDLSTSMLAEDYRAPDGAPLNRMEAIRPIIQRFIAGRPDDRIGIVLFSGRAFTLAPLTTDHEWLGQQVAALRIGMLEDGTAIGDGLGIALTGLEAGRQGAAAEDTAGQFVILLTDGANTSGSLTPPQSTAIARHRKIPVFTIGAGRNGMVPFPIFDSAGRRIGTRQYPSSLDVQAMQTMAAETGGQFVEAGNVGALATAFNAIDAARKTEFRVRTRLLTTELFQWPLGAAMVLLLVAAPMTAIWEARKARSSAA